MVNVKRSGAIKAVFGLILTYDPEVHRYNRKEIFRIRSKSQFQYQFQCLIYRLSGFS